MLLFFLKFFITNIVFSMILCSFLMRFNKNSNYSNSELILYSLGVGPAFTALLLYYAFLILPHHSNLFYLFLVVSVYFIIAISGRKNIKHIKDILQSGLKKMFSFSGSLSSQVGHFIYLLIIIILTIVFLIVFFVYILPNALLGHDVLNYAIAGTMLFDDKSLAPIWVKNFLNNGFLYKIRTAPSFSLLLTWEKLVNSIFHIKSDLYFRSISSYYGLLIIGIHYYWVAKRSKWLGLLSTLILLSSYGFLIIFLIKHIDSYRIFFLVVSWIFLIYAIKDKTRFSILLFGIFLGLTVSIHRIGLVLGCMTSIVYFIMVDDHLKLRLINFSFIILLLLFFGGGHYILDLIEGQGRWFRR